jgi:hypothetical protein
VSVNGGGLGARGFEGVGWAKKAEEDEERVVAGLFYYRFPRRGTEQ